MTQQEQKQERIAKLEAEIAEKTAELERVKAEWDDGRVRGEKYYVAFENGAVSCFADVFEGVDDYHFALGHAAKTALLAQHYFNRACARERVIAACEALGGGRTVGLTLRWLPIKASGGWDVCYSESASEISFSGSFGKYKALDFFRTHSADLDLRRGSSMTQFKEGQKVFAEVAVVKGPDDDGEIRCVDRHGDSCYFKPEQLHPFPPQIESELTDDERFRAEQAVKLMAGYYANGASGGSGASYPWPIAIEDADAAISSVKATRKQGA